MKVKIKAKLFLDANGLWRAREFDAKKNDKGMFIPPDLRGELNDKHNEKCVTLEKIDGKIVRLLFDGEGVEVVAKQGSQPVHVSIQSTPQHMLKQPMVVSKDEDTLQSSAVIAYQCAEAAIGIGKEYKNHAKSLPLMIRTNGLGATLAYLESKDEKHFMELLKNIVDFLKKKKHIEIAEEITSEMISNRNSSEIKELTKEVLGFLAWLRRFAAGLIPG
jgi:CRISPR-associated protein Cmr5